MNLFADFETLLNIIVHSAKTVENLFPHAANGIENVAQKAANAKLATALVSAALPAAGVAVPDEAIAKIAIAIPTVLETVSAAKSVYDSNITAQPS